MSAARLLKVRVQLQRLHQVGTTTMTTETSEYVTPATAISSNSVKYWLSISNFL